MYTKIFTDIMPPKTKRKFLKTIYAIQDNFGTSFGYVSRNFSFGLLPKKQEISKLDKWFNEVIKAKIALYKEIYEDFKKSPNKYLDNAFNYKTFFSGRSVIKSIKGDTGIITSQPVMEGLSMEITGSVRSFISNHKRIFLDNVSQFNKLKEVIKSNREIVKAPNLLLAIEDKLNQLTKEVLLKSYAEIIEEYKTLSNYEKLLHGFDSLISDYNYEINQLNTKLKLDLRILGRLSNLPAFPGVKEESSDDVILLLDKLKGIARKVADIDQVKILLADRVKRVDADKFGKRKRYEDRLLFYIGNDGKITTERAFFYLSELDRKILALENHFARKPFDALSRNQYFELLAHKARLADSDNFLDINSFLSRIKGTYVRGKETLEVVTVPGFSWDKKKSGKPLKNIAFAFDRQGDKDKLFLCVSASSKSFMVNEQGRFEFLKTIGGQKRKNSKPKEISYVHGDFLTDRTEGTPILLQLHFGKSYARRYLYQKKWGLLSKNPKLFLNNGRLKRFKKRPGDPWEYAFDITISGEKVFGFKDFAKGILGKAKSVIGVDRGEVKPIAYAIVNIRSEEVIQKGFLAENYIAKLLQYSEKKKQAQRLGRVPKYLTSKIARLQETILETSASEILSLLSSHKGIVAIEDLNRKFKGAEKSLIPKKTYKKVEKLLADSLELSGLVRIDNKSNYWGGLTKVSPGGTSQTCLGCKTKWNKEFKGNIYEYSKSKNYSNINWNKRRVKYNKENFQLNNNFLVYNREKRHNEEKNITDLKVAIDGQEKNKIARYFMLALGPRVKQDAFICAKCSFKENADLVGAVNIARRGAERITYLRNLK